MSTSDFARDNPEILKVGLANYRHYMIDLLSFGARNSCPEQPRISLPFRRIPTAWAIEVNVLLRQCYINYFTLMYLSYGICFRFQAPP